MSSGTNGQTPEVPVTARQQWMAILAKADVRILEQAWDLMPLKPPYAFLRPPEIGLAQVRARAGGTGQQFNLGEVTVSRCVVQLASGEIGVAYVMGRDQRHAELAAVFDAMLQTPSTQEQVRTAVIDVLAKAQSDRKRRDAEAAATTTVNFFTMVRGDG